MIKVNITADDYCLTNVIEDLAGKIDRYCEDIEDIYNGKEDSVTFHGEHYTAIISDGEDKTTRLFSKLRGFNCGQLTRFLRKVHVFGQKDYIALYDKGLVGDIIDNANSDGYHVYVDFQNLHDNFVYVKYDDSDYGKCVNIQGLSEDDWDEVFKLDKIAEDFCEELKKFV